MVVNPAGQVSYFYLASGKGSEAAVRRATLSAETQLNSTPLDFTFHSSQRVEVFPNSQKKKYIYYRVLVFCATLFSALLPPSYFHFLLALSASWTFHLSCFLPAAVTWFSFLLPPTHMLRQSFWLIAGDSSVATTPAVEATPNSSSSRSSTNSGSIKRHRRNAKKCMLTALTVALLTVKCCK